MLLHAVYVLLALISLVRSECLDTGICANYEFWGGSTCTDTKSTNNEDEVSFCDGTGLRTWATCNDENTKVQVYSQQVCGSTNFTEYDSGSCYQGSGEVGAPGAFRWSCVGPGSEPPSSGGSKAYTCILVIMIVGSINWAFKRED